MTYKELEKFICECCKNSVPISFKSFYQEIRENKEDIKWEICDDITNRWRRGDYYFTRRRKTHRFSEVYKAVIYKQDTNDSDNTLMFYYVSTDISKNNEIYILGVCKYPWSYELKVINKEQYKTYSRVVD